MTSNFLQVGRTIKCAHCAPNFQWIPIEDCPCTCHNVKGSKYPLIDAQWNQYIDNLREKIQAIPDTNYAMESDMYDAGLATMKENVLKLLR